MRRPRHCVVWVVPSFASLRRPRRCAAVSSADCVVPPTASCRRPRRAAVRVVPPSPSVLRPRRAVARVVPSSASFWPSEAGLIVLRGRLSDDSFKFMFAGWFLTPELFHLHRDTDIVHRATEVGDFFKLVSHLQECCSSVAFRTGRQLQIHRSLQGS